MEQDEELDNYYDELYERWMKDKEDWVTLFYNEFGYDPKDKEEENVFNG